MILKFFADFTVEGELAPTRNFNKIAINYLKGYFCLDAIALFPFQLIHMENHQSDLFYITKYIRIYQGFKLLNVGNILSIVKKK